MTLTVQAVRFHFRALSPLVFEPGKMTNFFRGAMGILLRRSSCHESCPGAPACDRRDVCTYARLFEPHLATGPSGLADPPRPFVLRADTLQSRRLDPGATFYLDVHLFDPHLDAVPHLTAAFQNLSRTELAQSPETQILTIPLEGNVEQQRATLTFLTPMELKHNGGVLREPDFGVLFNRARDRISTICTLYQGNTPAFDFHRLGEIAKQVRMVQSKITEMHWARTSSRTGITNGLGGFLGSATYEGPLTQLLPIIRAAYWTGIGRQTVLGLGAVRVD